MALALTTVVSGSLTVRDSIALQLHGVAFASLTQDKQDTITTAGTLSLSEVDQWADLYQRAGSGDNAPAEWAHWLVSIVVAKLSYTHHPERAVDARREEARARMACFEAFARKAVDYDPTGSDTEAFIYTQQAIRHHVYDVCVKLKPPIFPAVTAIDAATRWATMHAFNKGGWMFRTRPIVGVLESDSTITVSSGLESGESLDSFAVRKLYLTGDGEGAVEFVDADTMAMLRASDTDATGRPRYFRVRSVNAASTYTLKYLFWPEPDADYGFRAEVFTRTPAVPTAATNTPWALMVAEWLPCLKDIVLGRILMSHQRGREMYDEAMNELDSILAKAEGPGDVEMDIQVRDAYQDRTWQ